MYKGQIGGDFTQTYGRSIDEEIELEYLAPSSSPTEVISQMNPRSGEFHPPIPSETRVSSTLETNTHQPPTDKFSMDLPDPSAFKTQWQENRAVNIPNLFPTPQANQIRDYYFNQPNEWWDLILYPDPYFDYDQSAIENPGYYHMYRTQEGDPSIPERLAHIHKLNNDGVFSYKYRRTRDLSTQLHPYLQIFQTPQFRDYLSIVTGYENLQYDESHTFVSNYGPGDFNGPHTDGANGRIAFVFHLSKDWLPQYGGLFMRMDWDWKTVNKVIVPPFNTLSIFDTTWQDKQGAPHLVSEVAQGIDNRRISYTGWYL